MPFVPTLHGGRQASASSGPVAAIKQVLRLLQEEAEAAYGRLSESSTCGADFMRWLDSLEDAARREMAYRGFEPLGDRVFVPQRSREDLVIGYFQYGSVVIELGLRGLNRCGQLGDVAGGQPPRVYARIYMGGRASMVLEADEPYQQLPRERGMYIM